jgi:hypothetical protein
MPENASPTQYLRVIGRLYPDRQLALRPGYLTETPPWTDREGDSPLHAATFDENGALLGRFPLRVAEMCEEGGQGRRPQAVRGFVPFHPHARRLVFSYRGQPVHEIIRSNTSPRAEFTWQPVKAPAGLQTITWAGRHSEGLPVQFFLRFSNDGGQTWNRIGSRTSGFEQVIDFDELAGGERCQLALVATDGINTTIANSAPFTLARKPCVAMILQPLDGDSYPASQPVRLQGQGFWREFERPEWQQLAWYIDSDSHPAGSGAELEVSLPPGRHTITLLAGSEIYQGRAEVMITVGTEEGSF